jgi:uncharacterized protein YciI
MGQFVAMFCLCWSVLAALSQSAQGQSNTTNTTRRCIGKADQEKISAYVVLLRLRGDIYTKWKETGVWPAEPEADKAIGGHSMYWAQQLKAGHPITAGAMDGDYWDNVALIVFEAASSEEAESIVRADPAVRAHVFQAKSGRSTFSGLPTSSTWIPMFAGTSNLRRTKTRGPAEA